MLNKPSVTNQTEPLLSGKLTANDHTAQSQVPAREVFNQAAAAMGFPKDALSSAILAFARFFSLSLSPALMGNIRRGALTSGKPSSPATAKEKAALEAEALALVSALDKGVTLSPEALEHYATFLTPDTDSRKQGAKDREEAPDAEELQALAGEQAREDGLLNFLNSVPGKNGQYWTVYPFTIIIKGTELKVFLRILKRGPEFSYENEQIIADIAGPARQWRFFLRKTARLNSGQQLSPEGTGKYRADIRVYPDENPEALKQLNKEARRFLEKGGGTVGNFSGFEEITVQNGSGFSSWAEELCDESLPLIDKEV